MPSIVSLLGQHAIFKTNSRLLSSNKKIDPDLDSRVSIHLVRADLKKSFKFECELTASFSIFYLQIENDVVKNILYYFFYVKKFVELFYPPLDKFSYLTRFTEVMKTINREKDNLTK